MLNDKKLNKDKEILAMQIIQIQATIAQKEQELQSLRMQLMRLDGAIGYIMDNLMEEKT